MLVENEHLYFKSGVVAEGPPAGVGSVQIDVPIPHYILWGQRVEVFTKKTGFTEKAGRFSISARFWRSPDSDFELATKLERGEIEGDSFLKADSAVDLAVGIPGSLAEGEAACRDRIREITSTLDAAEDVSLTLNYARGLVQRFDEIYESAGYEEKRELAASIVQALGGAIADAQGLIWKTTGTRVDDCSRLSSVMPSVAIRASAASTYS